MGLLETLKEIEEEKGFQTPMTMDDVQEKELICHLKTSSLNFIGKMVFEEDEIETKGKTISIISGFHAEKIIEHEEPDKYFAGLRANHFSVEIGWSELSNSLNDIIVIVTANHKGTRVTTVWKA